MRLSVRNWLGLAIVCALMAGCPEEPSADGAGAGGGAGSAGNLEGLSCEELVTKIEALAKKKGCVEDDGKDYLEECDACPEYKNFIACQLSSEDNFYCGEGGDLKDRDTACVDSCNQDDDEVSNPSE